MLSNQFVDQPPAQVYHELLDDGVRLCSPSTMHRLLRQRGESSERRDQRPAQSHAVPRIETRAPNQVWCWDCSTLPTSIAGLTLTLYAMLDLFSRYAVAWMVSPKQNSDLAQQLFEAAVRTHGIEPGQLTVHQDRGSPMVSHEFLDQLIESGITPTHSRPRVSNDNPISEAPFKTLKYQPDYPGRFTGQEHATSWCSDYFGWYNTAHHHSALAGFTPEQVFDGSYRQVASVRQRALDLSCLAHPERFVNGAPKVRMPPAIVSINPYTVEEMSESAGTLVVNAPTLNRVKEKITLST